MKIHIPNSAFLGNIDPFLRGFDPGDPDSLHITLNPNWTSVHPLVISMIAALGLNVKLENIFIDKLEAKSSTYLVRMGLFKILNLACDTKIQEHAPEGRFIPVKQVRTSDELAEFITEMIPMLHSDPEQAKTIGYIISELGRNVLEHSIAKNGAILCAQFYAKSNTIRIGIADTGIGIRKSINQSHVATTDLEAIRLALWPGVTGTTSAPGGTAQNAGAGLFFVKSIANLNKDFFVIYSGNGFYKLLIKKGERIKLNADPFDDRHSRNDQLPYWQGTLVGVDITLDQTREYSELLDAIRDIYYALRKTRKPHKRPKFI
jgi:anti-sigma regulatory factor (Ser/Thr protein kinase)